MSRPSLPVRMDKRTPLVLVLGLAVVFATWWFYAKPASTGLEAAQAESARLTSEVNALSQRLAVSQAGGADTAATLFSQVQAADALLPASADLTRLLVEIPSSAAAQGLKLNQLDPAAPVPGSVPGLMSAPFTVSATGSSSSVSAWLAELQAGSELRTVSGLKKVEAEGGSTTATFTLNVWYSTTPPLAAGGGTAPGAAPVDPTTGTLPVDPATGLPAVPAG